MSKLFRDSTISLLDQAILSLTNFLVGVFLIQSTSKDDYGLYVLAYAIILYLVSTQNAVISTQMTVLTPQKSRVSSERFCGALAVSQYLIIIPLGLLAFALAVFAEKAGWLSPAGRHLITAIAAATLGVLLREFTRSLFFLRLRPGTVLAVDIVQVTLLFGGLFIVRKILPEWLHVLAIAIFGASSLISGALAMTVANLPLRQTMIERWAALREAWLNGRWALGGVSVTWIQDQSYIYLLGFLAGPASTAEASAARLLLMPVMLLNVAYSRIIMPRWAQLREEGQRVAIEAMARRIRRLLIALIVCYMAVLLSVKDSVIAVFLSPEYRSIGGLIAMWGLVLVVQIVRSNYSIMLQVYQRFRHLTLINVPIALVVVILDLALIPRFGANGALLALFIGELMLAFSMTVVWRKSV